MSKLENAITIKTIIMMDSINNPGIKKSFLYLNFDYLFLSNFVCIFPKNQLIN